MNDCLQEKLREMEETNPSPSLSSMSTKNKLINTARFINRNLNRIVNHVAQKESIDADNRTAKEYADDLRTEWHNLINWSVNDSPFKYNLTYPIESAIDNALNGRIFGGVPYEKSLIKHLEDIEFKLRCSTFNKEKPKFEFTDEHKQKFFELERRSAKEKAKDNMYDAMNNAAYENAHAPDKTESDLEAAKKYAALAGLSIPEKDIIHIRKSAIETRKRAMFETLEHLFPDEKTRRFSRFNSMETDKEKSERLVLEEAQLRVYTEKMSSLKYCFEHSMNDALQAIEELKRYKNEP